MAHAESCIFCNIAAGEIPADKVYEDDLVFAIRDISPQAPTHILIIPKAHRERLTDYEEADQALLGHLLLTANKIAETEGLSDFRCAVNCGPEGGQMVWHLHLHLLGGRQMGGQLG